MQRLPGPNAVRTAVLTTPGPSGLDQLDDLQFETHININYFYELQGTPGSCQFGFTSYQVVCFYTPTTCTLHNVPKLDT